MPANEYERRRVPAKIESKHVEEIKPLSVLWLQATDPTVFTPRAWESGGMTRIHFGDATGAGVVSVYRTVGKCLDGKTTIQDEVHVASKNVGGQFNYEIDEQGKLVQYTNNPTFAAPMQECIEAITPLVTQAGATIEARHQYLGGEPRFVNDGQRWIDRRLMEKLDVARDLPDSENSQLE